jgi:hypothetical protein
MYNMSVGRKMESAGKKLVVLPIPHILAMPSTLARDPLHFEGNFLYNHKAE